MNDKKTLQEIEKEWIENVVKCRSNGDFCSICEHEKECFFAARGQGEWPDCPFQ